MTTDIELGALLRRLREQRKEPLRVVAAAADMDSTLLSRIERGERVPTERQIVALAAHFAVPVDQLRPMRNAARMMRQWVDPQEVLRAADVIERSTGSSRGDRWMRTEALAEERGTDPRYASHHMLASDMHFAEPAAAPQSSGGRSQKLADIEAAANQGADLLDGLERATHDRDSVVALRATELLRQLRAKLG